MYAIYGNIYHFTINIPQMLAYIPYMDLMGYVALQSSIIIHQFYSIFLIVKPLQEMIKNT